MNISSSITKSFREYGNKITALSKDNVSTIYGFIQPLNYKVHSNIYESTNISVKDNMYYLLVAEKDSAVDSNDKLILDNSTYEVIKCQSYMYQNKCMYKWAILKLCYPILEDDFSGNS